MTFNVTIVRRPATERAREPSRTQHPMLRPFFRAAARVRAGFTALVRWADECRRVEWEFERRHGRPPRVE